MKFFESIVERVSRILSRQYGVQVVFEGTGACTDGKTIFLPSLPTDIDQETIDDIWGFCSHETGHCKFTDFPTFRSSINKFHQNLLNAVEDVRIEREMGKEFPGSKMYLEPLNEKLLAKIDAEWETIPATRRVIFSLRKIMLGETPILDVDLMPVYTDEVIALAKSCNDATSTLELYRITKEITNKIKSKLDDLEKEQEKEKENEEGKGEEKKDGKGEDKGKGEGKGKDKGKDKENGKGEGKGDKGKDKKEDKKDGKGKGEGKGKDKDEGKGKGKKGKKADEEEGEGESETGEGDGEGDGEEKETPCSLKSDDLDKDDGAEGAMDLEELVNEKLTGSTKDSTKNMTVPSNHQFATHGKHVPFTTKFDTVEEIKSGDTAEYARVLSPVKGLVNKVRDELDRILTVEEDQRWEPDQERGWLMGNRLARVALDKNFRTPFYTESKIDTRNVAVEIVVDLSGSMRGEKLDLAQQSVIAISEALNQLQIEFEVVGFRTAGMNLGTNDTTVFNRVCDVLRHYVFKAFDSTILSGLVGMQAGGANCDGESVRWAAKRLSMRNRERKIMLVFSDGYPSISGANHDLLNKDLKDALKDIERFGIETVGFGLVEKGNIKSAASEFYKDHIDVRNLESLPAECMKKLKQILIKKRR